MKDTSLGAICAFCKKDQTAEEECGEMCHSSNGAIHVHYLCLVSVYVNDPDHHSSSVVALLFLFFLHFTCHSIDSKLQ